MNTKLFTSLVAGVAVVATTQVAQANMGLEVLWAPTVADLQANDASVVVVDSPAQISGSSGSDAITFAGTGLAAGWPVASWLASLLYVPFSLGIKTSKHGTLATHAA